jgi:hypothetical protein
MTSTAYRQRVRNGLVVGACLMVMQFLIGGTIWQATGTTFSESFSTAVDLVTGSLFAGFLTAWLHGRQAGGRSLLDCGPYPYRKSCLVGAVFLPLIFLVHGVTDDSPANVFRVVVLPVLVALYCLVMAGGQLQVRQNGIWQYWRLLRWVRIESYRWADDGTWLVNVRGFSFFRLRALQVSPEQRDAFDALLQKHCPVEDTNRA